MKTAMQELIELIRFTDKECYATMFNEGLFDKALEKEKEQIADAFVECWKANMPDGFECKLSAKDYYNQTYNQNK
jgi:hypothetical protein